MYSGLEQPVRVVVVGTTCCGKTTFARRFAKALSAPHVELDALYWLPDWTPREESEFQKLAGDAVAGERWVIDGNYSRLQHLIFNRATTLIWLNYSFPRVLFRGVKRTTKRVLTGEAVYAGNRESFRRAFLTKDSILWWLVTTHHKRARRYRRIFATSTYPDLEKLEFRSPRSASKYLARTENAIERANRIRRNAPHP
jgi:adenylate kinase family enzyme